MAKDGTARGGSRVGSGRKSKALVDKISAGDPATVMELPDPPTFEGTDVPPMKEYLRAKQKNGKDLCASDVYEETWRWLKERGCERLVNIQLIEQYAMSVSRWIQCEEAISEYGFLVYGNTYFENGKAVQLKIKLHSFFHIVLLFNYFFPSLHSRFRSASTAPALRQRVRVEASSPSTTAFCKSLTRADSSSSASWDSSQLTGSE